MNKVKKVVEKYLASKDGIDAVRRANKEIKRQNKAKRAAREEKERRQVPPLDLTPSGFNREFLETKGVEQLKDLARGKVKGFSKMNKEQLVEALADA